jgi:katanin p80 WD40 repeat-containing subunit B1
VEFHPEDFLLASSSADRSVRFWDLENFQLVSKSDKETALIRCLHFSVDGQCLFAGCAEQLKVYGWEPACVFDTVTTGWGKVQDMATARDQLIGASFNLTRVLVCVVDIAKVSRTAPAASSKTGTSQASSPFSHGQTVRKSFNKQKPRPVKSVTAVKVKPISEEYDTDEDISAHFASYLPVSGDYETVFKPHRTLNRSPPPYEELMRSPSSIRSPFYSEPTSEDDVSTPATSVTVSTKYSTVTYHHEDAESSSHIPVPVKLPERRIPSPSSVQKHAATSPPPSTLGSPTTSQPPPPPSRSMANGHHSLKAPARRVNSSKADAGTQSDSVADSHTTSTSLPDVVSRPPPPRKLYESNLSYNKKSIPFDPHRRDSSNKLVPCVDDAPSQDNEPLVPSMSNAPVELRLEEFLPASYRNGGLKSNGSRHHLSEDEILASLSRDHEMALTIMKIRQRNLEIVYSLWHNQDLKCALESAVSMNDQAVLIDVLTAINKRPNLWNLDVCVVLLPALYNLLHSKYEMYMTVCCESLQLILRNFSSVIKTNVQWASPTIGVDISKEERYAKCVKCYDNLISIRAFLLKRQTMQGKLGQSFRELQSLLYAIEK